MHLKIKENKKQGIFTILVLVYEQKNISEAV